jgi:predicted patatin/cPLA2 family phospholipase
MADPALALLPDPPHPVVDVLVERARTGSLPGRRRDPHRLALVLEGGGMRGVVSAGMTAALIAGVARQGAATYHGAMASRTFVNPARVLRGRPVIDVNHVLEYATVELDAERHERVLASPIELHCVAVDVDTAKTVDFSGMRTKQELYDAVLASSRMPWAGGPPVEVGGRRYVDGGLLGSPIPVSEALAAGATHVLALQTRPHGVPRQSVSRIGDRLIERHLRGLNPALVTLYRERVASYERLVEEIARRTRDPGPAPPYVLGLRPPAGTPVVGQLERRPAILAAAAADAERLVDQALRLGAGPRPAPAG